MSIIRILLVEDDPRLQRSLCDILISRRYEVVCFGSGMAASGYLASMNNAVDILISDVDLGDHVDGFAVAAFGQRLRPSLRVLMMSADGADRFEKEKVEGAIFLAKPFGASQLFQNLDLLMCRPGERNGQQTLPDCATRSTGCALPNDEWGSSCDRRKARGIEPESLKQMLNNVKLQSNRWLFSI